MKTKSLMVLAGASLLAGFCLPTPCRAVPFVSPLYDTSVTEGHDTTLDGVNFQGVPIGTYDFGGSIGVQNVGNTDTIVQRLGISGNGQTVGLQLDALQLVSTTPINMSGNFGYFYLTLQNGQASGGTTTINSDGTYSSAFNIFYDVRYGSLTGPIVQSGEAQGMNGSGTWHNAPPSNALLIPGVNYLLNGTDTSNDFWPSDPVQYQGVTDTIVQRITVTPEPGTLTLLGLGLAAAGLRIRRRRA